MSDYINNFTVLDQAKIAKYQSLSNSTGNELLDKDTRGYTRETKESLIFYLSKPDSEDLLYVDIPKAKQSEDSKARLSARALASSIIEKENLFGANRIFAVDPETGVVVREDELGKPIKELEDFDQKVWNPNDFLNLMLTLDHLIQLDINPKIDTENILLANDQEKGELGFIVTDYAHQQGYKDKFDSIKTRREYIIGEVKKLILPEMKKAFPEEADELEQNFQNTEKLFLDTKYLDFEKDFEEAAKDFEPALSSIAAKIDHYNSIGSTEFYNELTHSEKELKFGEGGECIVIKGKDPSKLAKIYYRGDSGAIQEIKALERAQEKGLSHVAKPIAFKNNIVIEEKLPGKTLDEYLNDAEQNQVLIQSFKTFLPDFFKAMENLYNNGLFPDPQRSNILLDPEQGFFFPDLCIDESGIYKGAIENIYREFQNFTNKVLKGKIKDHNELTRIYEDAYENYIHSTPSSSLQENPRNPR